MILHVDMDAFYASVELRRHPELRGQPVAVGGTGRRGVIAAASYEARRFGVFSAMPTVTARRACPHLVLLPGDYAHYAEVSEQIGEIFRSLTPLVEPLSLDEAFLDVTGAQRLFGDGRQIAALARRRIDEQTGLACAVGVAPNKFLAKLASKAAKPKVRGRQVVPGAGVVEVRPGEELAFLHPLPVQSMWGVGPATLTKLSGRGVRTVGDLAHLGQDVLVKLLGNAAGRHLAALAWGRDDRPVEVERAARSIGHEETFAHDRCTHEELHVELVRLADGVAARLRAAETGARTLTLKVRFAAFTTVTRSVTLAQAVTRGDEIVAALDPLLGTLDVAQGVRLLGVSTSRFELPNEQLALDDPTSVGDAGWQAATVALDEIRRRFGAAAIAPATAARSGAGGRSEVRVVRRGAQQWGPQDPAG